MLSGVLSSDSFLAVFPLQDWLAVSNETRRADPSVERINNPADPEEDIKARAMYISRLERYDRRKAADGEELRKFVLAAYNAGMGRIDECMSYAELRGKDSSRWEEITEVIPEMSDSSVVESGVLKYGKFLGKETIYFVDKVTDLYHQFYRICPD